MVISPLILAVAGAAHDQHEASQAREATLALIAEALPDAAKAADPIAEARRQLAAAPPPGGMAAASAALFAAVEGVEGAELDGMSSSAGQGLRATVSYPAFGDLDAMRTALNGSGLSLSDTSTVEDGGRVLVNELNTIPGMTPTSAFPKLWEAAGVPWPQAVDRLMALALERHAAERRRAH